MAVDAGGRTGGVRRGLGGRVAHRMWRRRKAQEQARLRQVPPLPDSTTNPTKPSKKGHPNENYLNKNRNAATNAKCSHDNNAKIGEVHTKQQENMRLTCRKVSMSDDSSIENDDISDENSDSEDESEEFSSSDDSDTDNQKETKTGRLNNVSIVNKNVSNREKKDEFAEEIQETSNESSQKISNEHAEGAYNEQSQITSNEQSQKIFNEQSQGASSEQSRETSNEQKQKTSNEQSQVTSNEQSQETSNEQSQGTTDEQVQRASNKQGQESLHELTIGSSNEQSNETFNEQGQGTRIAQSQIAKPERNPDNFLPFAEILRLHQLALIQKQFKTQVPEVPEVKTTKIIEHKRDDFPEWSDFLAMHEAKQKREYEEDHPEAALAMSPISSEENKWICEEWAKMWAKCEENQHGIEIEEHSAEETSRKCDDYGRGYCQGREEKNAENFKQYVEDQQLESEVEEYEAESIIEYDDFQVMPMSTVDEKNIVIQDNDINMRRYEAMQDEIERKWLAAQKVKEVEERFKAEKAERERSRNGIGYGRRQNTRYEADRMKRERARWESDRLKREREKIHNEFEILQREGLRLETQCAGIAGMRTQGDRTRRGRMSCEIERVKREWSLYEAELIALEEVRHNSERDQREQLEVEFLMHQRVTREVRLIKHLRQQTESIKQELTQHETERIERNWARQEVDHLKRENFRSQAERDGPERAQFKTRIHERKMERRAAKCVGRNRHRLGPNCFEAEGEPDDLKCVKYKQVEHSLQSIIVQILALIPIYQQNCQEAQRNQLADLLPRLGAQRIQQISLAGALSDHVLELGARRENAVDTFSQREPIRQIQLAFLGGINRQDVLQMSLWEEFFGVRLNQELLLAPETRCEQTLGFRTQRELFITLGEQREQVLSIFVKRIHRLGTPARRAHTSRSIARLQRILHMKEVLFHRCMNNREIVFPVITIWEENIVNGFNLAGPLQDLEQYLIHDIVQRPQVPVQLELHVRIQYPIRNPLMVCPNLHLPDPDQASGPASVQLSQCYPVVNSQIAPLHSTPQDPQQNHDYDFVWEEDQVSQEQKQDPQELFEQISLHDSQLSQRQIPEKYHEQSPEQGREPIRRRSRRRNITMRGQPLLFILFLLTPGFALHVKTCSSPLGMESGEILDSALTASSSYVSNVGPQCARLNKEHLGGGWCPKGQVEATSREYVEVDFGGPRLITGLATQGRHGQGRGVEYLEGYTIEYFRPSLSSWHGYRRWDGNNVFSGNSDTVTVVQHSFTPPLHATNLRVYPHSLHLRTICLRMEVYGCEDDSGLLSYAAPAGSADLGDHVDREYDGVDGEDGLGRLTDGQIGGDFFLIDIGYARGSGWVGWRNSSFPSGYLEITFTFDAIRNISQVNLFANNYHSRNVQVFRTAVVYFSVGGKYFNGDPVVFSQHPDKNNESARNVSIPFNGGRLAKYTKIRLYFQSEWIMLGEVYFTSEITETNVTDEIHQKVFDDILELTLLNMDYDKSQYEPPSDLMIGSLAIVVLIVVALFLGMLVVHKRKAMGIFKRSNSYLGNDFSMKINMKDLFTNFTPGKDTAVDVLDSSPPSNYEARPPMIIRGELPGLAIGEPCTLPLPPGNTLTRRKQSYVTATSPRRGKAVVTLAPPPVPPADLTFRTLYGQRPCSSKARDGPKYVDVSGGNMRGKAGGGAGWGGRNGSTDLLAISDLEDMHRRFLTPEQINNLTGAPAYVVWNIAPGLRNPRQEEDRDRVGGSDLPLSYLNLVSHSATGDLSSVDILQHSNFLCRRVSTIQNRGSRRHHSQDPRKPPYLV